MLNYSKKQTNKQTKNTPKNTPKNKLLRKTEIISPKNEPKK